MSDKNINSQTKAKNKYNAKTYDRISFFVLKGDKDKIKSAAENVGESVNGYIKKAVDNRIESGK